MIMYKELENRTYQIFWSKMGEECWAKFNTEKTCHINTSRLDSRLGEHQSRYCIRTNFQFFLLFEESTTSVG